MTRRIAIVAALALSLGVLPVLARHQDPGRVGRGGPHMRGGGRGGPGGPMGLLPGLNRIDLSEAQREQIRAILEQERRAGEPGQPIRQAEQALRTALLAQDAAGVEAAKAALTAAEAAGLERRVQITQKIVQILTTAQRQQLDKPYI